MPLPTDDAPPNPHNRTRWLPMLDEVMRQDRQGLIDDMLQVLREHGVTRECTASVALDERYLVYPESKEGYLNYATGLLASEVGWLLKNDGLVMFSQERDPEPRIGFHQEPPQRMVAKLTVVRNIK